MKILYLDLNIQYHNPTGNNIVLLLKKISELYVYGLGYQPEEILNSGVEQFYKKHGPFDFIVTNEHIVFDNLYKSNTLEHTIEVYKKSYYLQFNLLNIKKVLNELFLFFSAIKANKVIFLLQSDYYNFQKEKIERLDSLCAHIVGFGEDIISHTDDLNDLQKESFAHNANNNWYNFILKNSDIIQLPHFINSSEFYFECLSNRKSMIYVAGANYYHRKKVIEVIKKSHYKIDDRKIYNKIYSILRKLHFKPDANPILMRLYNILFRNEIEHSRYSFTCGSGLEWPIRKFFEIPAMGSLLFAKPFKNAKKFGFIDNETYIKTDYINIVDNINYLEKNLEKAQEIARKGQELIWAQHSLDARAEQLRLAMEAIIESRFHGSYWKDGEFNIRDKNDK